jgi:hypothetical protein
MNMLALPHKIQLRSVSRYPRDNNTASPSVGQAVYDRRVARHGKLAQMLKSR